METTNYYEQRVRQKHPEIRDEWVERVLANPYHTETQPDGRIRYYGFIEEAGKWLRLVIEDGRLHNRFFDRDKLRRWGRP
ncbi:MAG: hypothetical protein F4Y49_04590 [Dehalococcoidia bacterium]|nr:hypothetical protein [Dehalococcoidia bacterium]